MLRMKANVKKKSQLAVRLPYDPDDPRQLNLLDILELIPAPKDAERSLLEETDIANCWRRS